MLNSTETASEIIVARLSTVADVLIPNEKTFPVYDARFVDFWTVFMILHLCSKSAAQKTKLQTDAKIGTNILQLCDELAQRLVCVLVFFLMKSFVAEYNNIVITRIIVIVSTG
jgi:hypothetical protein